LIRETENAISAAEEEAAALSAEIARPEPAADYKKVNELSARLCDLHARLDELYAEYEKLL